MRSEQEHAQIILGERLVRLVMYRAICKVGIKIKQGLLLLILLLLILRIELMDLV